MKGVFTTRVVPDYDDLPEWLYQFPRTHLRQGHRRVGGWIVHGNPRRSEGNHPGDLAHHR